MFSKADVPGAHPVHKIHTTQLRKSASRGSSEPPSTHAGCQDDMNETNSLKLLHRVALGHATTAVQAQELFLMPKQADLERQVCKYCDMHGQLLPYHTHREP